MAEEIRIIQYGLGPIGSAVARHVVERGGLKLVGGVDIDPAKAGKDLGLVIGLGQPLGCVVTEKLSQTLAQTPADVVLHTTSSYFELFMDQIIEILQTGLDIVSTAEELSFPWLANAEQAAQIDAAARRAGKTVLGTGVNPGFIMDALPLSLTAICQEVHHIEVTRVIDASARRGPFQAKIGSGLTVEQFQARMAAGRMGHVGLPESVGMVFDTLGKKLVSYQAQVEPVITEKPVETEHFRVEAGQVIGLKQVARGYSDDGEFMTLTFVAALAAGEDGDTIKISGKPDLEVRLKGTNGDIATVAIAVNAVRRVRNAEPGLVTMRDLPLVTAW
jgi:4-hydroxy-tetrahydrodipicolinate reductase